MTFWFPALKFVCIHSSTNLFLQLCQPVCPLLLRVRAGAALALLTFTAELALR